MSKLSESQLKAAVAKAGAAASSELDQLNAAIERERLRDLRAGEIHQKSRQPGSKQRLSLNEAKAQADAEMNDSHAKPRSREGDEAKPATPPAEPSNS